MSKKGIFFLFLIIVFTVFFRSLFNPYVFDSTTLLGNIGWNQEELASFGILIDSSVYAGISGSMSYRPLTTFVYMLVDARIFYFIPVLSHALNLLIHALNGFLLYHLLRDKNEAFQLSAFLASILFLVHPLVSETVLCVGFRGDLQALSFVLLSFILYKYTSHRDKYCVFLVPFLFFLAFFTKEIGIILVPMFTLYLWIFHREYQKGFLYGLVLFLLFVLFFLIWKKFQYTEYPSDFMGGQGRMTGMVNFLVSFYEIYLSKFFVPYPLRIDYHFDPVVSLFSLRVIMSLFALVCLLVLWGLLVRKNYWILFGGAWIFFSFLPLCQIIAVPDPVAERFCYVPMVGVAMIAFGLLSDLPRNRIRLVRIVFGVALLCLGLLSAHRCWDWQDEITLNIRNWEMAGDQRPVSLRSLGALYLNKAGTKGLSESEKVEAFSKSYSNLQLLLDQYPDDFEANRLMMVWYLANGQKSEAGNYFNKAKKIKPHSSDLQRLEILFQEKSEKN